MKIFKKLIDKAETKEELNKIIESIDKVIKQHVHEVKDLNEQKDQAETRIIDLTRKIA